MKSPLSCSCVLAACHSQPMPRTTIPVFKRTVTEKTIHIGRLAVFGTTTAHTSAKLDVTHPCTHSEKYIFPHALPQSPSPMSLRRPHTHSSASLLALTRAPTRRHHSHASVRSSPSKSHGTEKYQCITASDVHPNHIPKPTRHQKVNSTVPNCRSVVTTYSRG